MMRVTEYFSLELEQLCSVPLGATLNNLVFKLNLSFRAAFTTFLYIS